MDDIAEVVKDRRYRHEKCQRIMEKLELEKQVFQPKDMIFNLREIMEKTIIPQYASLGAADIDVAMGSLKLTIYPIPFEDGSNIGEIEFRYNKAGHAAIWGLYVDGSVKCFMD